MSRDPTVELWTLYAFGLSFTLLRTYARIFAVEVRELHPDDYLIWLAVVYITLQRCIRCQWSFPSLLIRLFLS